MTTAEIIRGQLARQAKWRAAGLTHSAIFEIIERWEREETTYSRMIEEIRELCERVLEVAEGGK